MEIVGGPRSRRFIVHRPLRYVFAVVLLALAAAGCGDSGSDGGARSPVSAPPPAQPPTAVADATPSDPVHAGSSGSRVSIVTTLRRYTAALAAKDVGGLQATLAPQVRVFVRGSGGCSSFAGRQEAVTGYAAQFLGPSGPYAFAPVRPGAGKVRTDAARATRSQRRPAPKRIVRVRLVRAGAAWRIARIGSPCAAGSAPGGPGSAPGGPTPGPGPG